MRNKYTFVFLKIKEKSKKSNNFKILVDLSN